MATIDLQRFMQTFLDESREGLDAMEQGLLRLEQGHGDAETINTIFRAAHSIKGGAGTFGLTEMTRLTHLLETLLDQMRSGQRAAGTAESAALIRSVDVLRDMLDAAQSGAACDAGRVAELSKALEQILGGAGSPAATSVERGSVATWSIHFSPKPGMLKGGNDPLRILAELAELGALKVECDLSRLPAFGQLEPENAYLSWHLELATSAPRSRIEEAFAWVEGECDLYIIAPAAEAPIASETPAADGGEARAAAQFQNESGSIRVGIDKVDALINLVGELVITQAMIKQCSDGLEPAQHERLLNGLALLERNTRDLQDSVMSVRMLPMDFVFSRFPRVVRDLSGKLGKNVRLHTEGGATELDKSVIEKIVDPLTHLVRNAIDHGLQGPDERRAAGKDETGTITLGASHRAGSVIIEVTDDGRGLDRARILASAARRGLAVPDGAPDADVWQLIFTPGLSTAEAVTDLSGRGVGMDVVKRNIVSLGGQVDVWSMAGEGTKVTIRLPLTLAILDGMSVAVGEEIFIVPLNSVVESLQPAADDVKTIVGTNDVLRVRGECVPLFSLRDVFSVRSAAAAGAHGTVVLMEAEGRKVAIRVDELVGQQQVVIKNLDANYRRIPGISGATIMGDGRVALIVDVGGLSRLAQSNSLTASTGVSA
ncbi:MAG: chemotaxis protein CheA [Gammaproteobacteria bacterium]